MSRRILSLAAVTAAVLIAASAKADRECFENSCELLPDLSEAPAQAAPTRSAEPAANAAMAEAAKLAPRPGASRTADAALTEEPAAPREAAASTPAMPAPVKQDPRAQANAAATPAEPRAEPPPINRAATEIRPRMVIDSGLRPTVQHFPAPSLEPRRPHKPVAERPQPPVPESVPLARGDDPVTVDGPSARSVARTFGYRVVERPHRGYRITPAYVFAPDAKIISIQSGD